MTRCPSVVTKPAGSLVAGGTVDALLADPAPLRHSADGLADQVRAVLERERSADPTLEALLDLRYAGQSYELEIPLALPVSTLPLQRALATFHEHHERRYGYAMEDRPVEAVTLRVRGRLPGAQLTLAPEPLAGTDVQLAYLGEKPVWFDEVGPTATPCYDRARLRHGHRFAGPAVVFQYDTTLVVSPGWHARVDAWRNVWVEQ